MSAEREHPEAVHGQAAEQPQGSGGQPDQSSTVTVENIDGSGRRAGSSDVVERAVGVAREQAEEAAEALRRGEFMRAEAVDPAATSDDRLIALLCFVTQPVVPLVMPVIVLVSESSQKRPFQRYHAVQSLALALLAIGVVSALVLAGSILFAIPLLGWLVGGLVLCFAPIVGLMALMAFLYYGYQAYQGKRFAIPGLTSFLQDQGWL